MNKILFTLSLAFCLCSSAENLFAQQYSYKVDLQNIIEDRVKVICMVPKQPLNKIDFIFPNLIPGSYALKEFGRYIVDFRAYDADGNKLIVKKADKYNFSILDASKLRKVEYLVDDSWEEPNGKRFIFQPGGTNIEATKNFVINNSGFFGYIDGMKNLPFNISFTKPAELKGYSYLKFFSINPTTDSISAVNYDVLVDNPIMYCSPQDASFKIGNAEISVCVYSENKLVSAAVIAEIVKPIAKALEHFFGTLPVDRYLFMFYLANPENTPKRSGKGLGSGFGALEHNHCSFYYMPERADTARLKEELQQVCAHEFLHILTPLNLHSHEIEDFNFRAPMMSKHLWMYEGVTEYFSLLIQLQDSIIKIEEFMDEMRSKMYYSSKFNKFSMTAMSKDVVKKKNQARYNSVYSRGALLAMMLDILIIDNSFGKNSLKNVMMTLTKKYGPTKPFNDDALIPEIIALTCPQVGDFMSDYIEGKEIPDYSQYLNLIAYEYFPVFEKSIYYFGRLGIIFDTESKHFTFTNIDINNLFSVQENDELIAINDSLVTEINIKTLYANFFNNNESSDLVKLEVIRNDKRLELSAKPKKAIKSMNNYIRNKMDADPKAIRNLKILHGVEN